MKRFSRHIVLGIISCWLIVNQADAQAFFTNDGQTITITSGAVMTVDGEALNKGILRNDGTFSVSGDWTNSNSYIADAGIFILNSNAVQQVDHGGQTFYILQLEGGGRKVFNSDIEILSSLILLSGVAEVPSDRSFLLREGVSVSGGSDDSYVEGLIYASGTGDLFFPVGRNGNYAPVELLDVSGTSPVIGMTVSEPNPTSIPGFGLTDLSTERYWRRELLSGTFTDAQVKLAIKNESFISNVGDVVVAGSNSLGGEYTSLGQSAVTGDANDGSVTSEQKSDNTFFTLGIELNEGRLADSLALVDLFQNNPGDWTSSVNWTQADIPLDQWDNITVNGDGRVSSLIIRNGGMAGQLTRELRTLTELLTLDLSGNELSGTIPDQLNQLESLQTLNLANNKIERIPDLTGLPSLTTFDVSNNNLLFSSIEPYGTGGILNYSPQNKILNTGDDIRRESGIDFTVSIPDDSPNSEYQWFFDGEEIDEATSFEYQIVDLNRSNMGRYFCRIQNTVITDLEIFSEQWTILAEASINGRISISETQNLSAGSVKLLKVTESGAYEEAAVAPLSPTGFFQLSDTLADYVLLVDPFDAETYIPTYYERTIQWDGADIIELNNDTTGFDILIQEVPPTPLPGEGNGTISGDVFTDFPEDGRIEARRRVRRVGVALRRRRSSNRTLDEDFELFAYTQTDDEGKFSFGNLPVGTYRIFIEFPGIPIDESSFTEFEIGEDLDENSIGLEATVFEDGIVIEKVEETGIPYDYLQELSIYPNPVNNTFMYVAIQARKNYEINFQLIDLRGQVVYNEEINSSNLGNGVRKIDVTNLSSGLYVVKITVPSYQNQLYKIGKIVINGR